MYFCPPPRSCHCLAGPSVTLSIGSVHGVRSEWAGSQYACQCIDNVKFGVKCSMCICCAHYTRACEARPKADILYCLQLYCIVATLCCNILLALYCVNTIQYITIHYITIQFIVATLYCNDGWAVPERQIGDAEIETFSLCATTSPQSFNTLR